MAEAIAGAAAGRSSPVVVALDGRSGSGKSTLARAVADRTGAAVISGDDFYAGGTAEAWDAMDPEARAAHCIDWRRQRPVLEALRRHRRASWTAYDWEADDGRHAPQHGTCEPHRVVILEGAYSGRPELADLLDLRVLLDVPEPVRRARLLRREGDGHRSEWEARWSSAEEHYFGCVMTPDAFDLVVSS